MIVITPRILTADTGSHTQASLETYEKVAETFYSGGEAPAADSSELLGTAGHRSEPAEGAIQ